MAGEKFAAKYSVLPCFVIQRKGLFLPSGLGTERRTPESRNAWTSEAARQARQVVKQNIESIRLVVLNLQNTSIDFTSSFERTVIGHQLIAKETKASGDSEVSRFRSGHLPEDGREQSGQADRRKPRRRGRAR